MKSAFSGRRNFAFYLLPFALCLFAACSLPNFESAECEASQGVVKEFYSFHFGNEMRFSAENLKAREKFLTPELAKSLQNSQTDNDVFTTGNTDYPKAFRVGKCRAAEPSKSIVEVLLFWKTDERTEQKTISVEVVRQGDKWLVNKIINQ